jgi:ribosomal protein S18 acetylase RimI-like enzyme
VVRPAGPSDADRVAGLMRAYYAEDGYPYDEPLARAAVAALIDDASLGRLWVIESGGTVVGYLALTLGFSLEYHGRDAFIDELYVAPEHRGRGLARAALDAAEQACHELGVRALHLEVERDNAAGLSLYRKLGFSGGERYLLTKRLG